MPRRRFPPRQCQKYHYLTSPWTQKFSLASESFLVKPPNVHSRHDHSSNHGRMDENCWVNVPDYSDLQHKFIINPSEKQLLTVHPLQNQRGTTGQGESSCLSIFFKFCEALLLCRLYAVTTSIESVLICIAVTWDMAGMCEYVSIGMSQKGQRDPKIHWWTGFLLGSSMNKINHFQENIDWTLHSPQVPQESLREAGVPRPIIHKIHLWNIYLTFIINLCQM